MNSWEPNTEHPNPEGEVGQAPEGSVENPGQAAETPGDPTGEPSARGEGESVQGGEETPSGGGSGALDELRATHEALNDRHLRLVAEFDNFRRRVNQERLEMWGRAQAELVGKLLDSLDDLQRVSDLDPETATTVSVLEGVELVERKFLRTLTEAGAEELNPDGGVFDPNVMEAVMRTPTDDPDLDDHIDQVFQKGYMFKGNLVRPVRVSVYKIS
jgi:molecular chaperone GrpE